MDLAYAVADVVVARAGALTISELCLAAKPAILVPSPNVADDHQTANAQAMLAAGAARMVTDADAAQHLAQSVQVLLHDAAARQLMSNMLAKLAKPLATQAIVDKLVAIAR